MRQSFEQKPREAWEAEPAGDWSWVRQPQALACRRALEDVRSRVTRGSPLSFLCLLTGLRQMTRHLPKLIQSDAFLLKEASRPKYLEPQSSATFLLDRLLQGQRPSGLPTLHWLFLLSKRAQSSQQGVVFEDPGLSKWKRKTKSWKSSPAAQCPQTCPFTSDPEPRLPDFLPGGGSVL